MTGYGESKELVVVETNAFSLYIKGVPYNRRFESLNRYRKHTMLEKEVMTFRWQGENVTSVEMYDVVSDELKDAETQNFSPIFFENGIYQLVITPKEDRKLRFYHEHPRIREAVSPVGRGMNPILMGNLQFTNEVGHTTLSIYEGHKLLLDLTIEIFPSKLSYKEDYEKLLEEVNDEVYNLAFHFIKKTFLGASEHLSEKPSLAEFFRLLEHYFTMFIKAILQIEKQPHHQLMTQHKMVRGECIKRLDQRGRKYLRRKPHVFKENDQGITINEKNVFPMKGLNPKKSLTFDTLENRFVKWMMQRLMHKLEDLVSKLMSRNRPYEQGTDELLIRRIRSMHIQLKTYLTKPFWKSLSPIDRKVSNIVMQRKVGYRDAYKIYLIVTRGLALQGELFKMSVKDVATLYEYWTYLKIGQILRKNYEAEEQEVIKIRHGALFVDLDQTSNARQIFRHPQTNERIILSFQKGTKSLPTVRQKPDIMLEVEKNNVPYRYHYIFDAKYRIDFTQESNGPGPLDDDINTMHRYRDAHVMKFHNNTYERYAFGAYVLFPWHDELAYQHHPFYKSIDEVNIGGLPFLPNSITLVERFIERLIESNPEDLQEEGILPQGAFSHWESLLDEKVLIGTVNNADQYYKCKQKGNFEIHLNALKDGWQEAKYIALYVTNEVSTSIKVENGILFYGKVTNVEIMERMSTISFKVDYWMTLKEVIRPVGYGVQSHIFTTMNLLTQAKEVPELFMKSDEEIKLWRMLRRLTSKVKTNLDDCSLDYAKKVQAYHIGHVEVVLDSNNNRIEVLQHGEILESVSLEDLRKQPSYVFKVIKQSVFLE